MRPHQMGDLPHRRQGRAGGKARPGRAGRHVAPGQGQERVDLVRAGGLELARKIAGPGDGILRPAGILEGRPVAQGKTPGRLRIPAIQIGIDTGDQMARLRSGAITEIQQDAQAGLKRQQAFGFAWRDVGNRIPGAPGVRDRFCKTAKTLQGVAPPSGQKEGEAISQAGRFMIGVLRKYGFQGLAGLGGLAQPDLDPPEQDTGRNMIRTQADRGLEAGERRFILPLPQICDRSPIGLLPARVWRIT